jgi:hypothetical protein
MARVLHTLLAHAGDGHSVLGLKMLVRDSICHALTLREWVLHFRVEAAVHMPML